LQVTRGLGWGSERPAFPLAAVEGYKDLIPAMTNDPKDRHVLAAAVRGNADLIVTANLKDFPDAALEPYGIQAIHPDQFLLDQLDLDPVRVVQVVAEQRDSYTRPELSAEEFSHSLAVTVPDFASAVTAAAAAAFGPDTPLPLEIVSPGAAHHAFFPDDDPSPETDRGAAFLWWQALLGGVVEFRPALQRLSTNHAAWGDYSAAASSLHGWAMMQFVESCPDAPGLVAGVGEHRIGCQGLVFAKDPGDPTAAEFGAVLVEEHRMILTARAVEMLLGEVSGQQRRRVGVDRDVTGLASFAGQRGHGGIVQTDVTHGQVGEFLDPGRGPQKGCECCGHTCSRLSSSGETSVARPDYADLTDTFTALASNNTNNLGITRTSA